jgi:hypothetical protein
MEESSTVLDDMGLMLLPTHVNGVVKIVGSVMDWFYSEECWARESNIQLMYLASMHHNGWVLLVSRMVNCCCVIYCSKMLYTIYVVF